MKKEVKKYLEKLARSDDQATKEEFLNIVMRQLFCMPTEPEIFEKLPEKDKKIFIEDAKVVKELPVWNKLIEEMKYIACQRIFNTSKSWEEILGGKFMIFTIDVMEKKIEKLSKM